MPNNVVILIFLEQADGTGISNVSIFLVYNDKVKVVFNKAYIVNKISQSTNSFLMELQSNTLEYKENRQPYEPAILHEIKLENGVLKFKDK